MSVMSSLRRKMSDYVPHGTRKTPMSRNQKAKLRVVRQEQEKREAASIAKLEQETQKSKSSRPAKKSTAKKATAKSSGSKS